MAINLNLITSELVLERVTFPIDFEKIREYKKPNYPLLELAALSVINIIQGITDHL